MKRQKPLYIIILSIIVICLIAYQFFIIINRIGNANVGNMLSSVNDFLAMVFLLLYLNISIKFGALFYSISFI